MCRWGDVQGWRAAGAADWHDTTAAEQGPLCVAATLQHRRAPRILVRLHANARRPASLLVLQVLKDKWYMKGNVLTNTLKRKPKVCVRLLPGAEHAHHGGRQQSTSWKLEAGADFAVPACGARPL